jgi:raffinose/stachyose/melibiose transport system substrate-binding protein
MQRSWRLASVALAALALWCAVVSPAAAKPNEQVSLSGLFVNTNTTAFGILIKNFNNVYPDIQIDRVQYLTSGTLRTLLLTQLGAGNAPDLFFVNGGNSAPSAVWPLAQTGHLLDLGSRPWVKRLGLTKSRAQWNGKTYALPIGLFLSSVAYNRKLFRQLNLRVPTTFPQLLTMCRQITAAGKIPFAQGFAEASGLSNWISAVSFLPYVRQPNWNELRTSKRSASRPPPPGAGTSRCSWR